MCKNQRRFHRGYKYIGIGLLLCLLIGSGTAIVRAQTPAPITIIETTATSMTIEFHIDTFAWEQVVEGAETFYRVQIPDLSQRMDPGRPELPVAGALLGVPATVGLTVTLINSSYETYSGYHLHLAERVARTSDQGETMSNGGWLTDPMLIDVPEDTDEFLPATLVDLDEVGYLRDQATAQLTFYPVQYNAATQSVRIYRQLTARLTWKPTVAAGAHIEESVSPVFESLLQVALLNYETLDRPDRTALSLQEKLPAPPVATAQYVANATPAFKIGVDREGIYRLGAPDLRTAGLDPSTLDPRKLQLSNHGVTIPILVAGEDDGHFDEADFILFYGTAIESAYTKLNIYWLTIEETPGLRMGFKEGQPSGGPSPAAFPTRLHAEEDTAYWQAMRGSADRWFWGTRLAPNTDGLARERTYPFSLQEIANTDRLSTVRVNLQGYTGLEHRTQIYLNDTLIDDQSWRGQTAFTHNVQLPHSLLRSGDNQIRVTTVKTIASIDQILVNWIEVDYQAAYKADKNELWFGLPAAGQQEITVHGFKRDDIFVWDVTDPAHPIILMNTQLVDEGRRFALHSSDSGSVASRYYAFSPEHFQPPLFFYADQPSAWRSTANAADYILITSEQFYASALLLADHRRQQGLRVAIIGIQDIYDEFSHGLFDPHAIRDFLAYAYTNWQRPAPLYVLLLGDANQDYKDNLGNGTVNYVPSWNLNSALSGEVSSDDWFAQVHGDDHLPDLLVGRLVAQSDAEATAIVAKIIRYETGPSDQSWNKQVLLVADDDDTRFQELSERLADQLPFDYTKSRVYDLSSNPQQQIVNAINTGQVLVNYAGHGEFFGWGIGGNNAGSIFHKDDVAFLANGERLPVITVGNCLNGFFAGPKTAAALAEVLQRTPERGAVAIWAPSGLGYPTGHAILLERVYEAIFRYDQLTLGGATTAAKIATLTENSFWADLTQSYILFGDPATRLAIPPNPPYLTAITPAEGVTNLPLDEPITVTFDKAVDPTTVKLQVTDGPPLTFVPYWNKEQNVVRFLHDQFSVGQHYKVAISAQDFAGHPLRNEPLATTWSFRTTDDGVSPTATLRVQGDDPNAVITTGLITLDFNEPVRPSKLHYTIVPWVDGEFHWSSDMRQAIFQHSRFTEGQSYTFTLEEVQDRAGNSLAQPVEFSFTVAETGYFFLPFVADATVGQ